MIYKWQKAQERISASLAVKTKQIKAIARYYYTPARMAKILKIVITSNAGKDAEKLDH